MQLLALIPCERLIQDPTQGQSLISVVHGLKIYVPRDVEIPLEAVMPKDWAVFSKHWLLPTEENLLYSAVVEVFWPDGKLFVRGEIPSQAASRETIAFGFRFNALPFGQNGTVRIVHTMFCEEIQVSGPDETFIKIEVIRVSPDLVKAEVI